MRSGRPGAPIPGWVAANAPGAGSGARTISFARANPCIRGLDAGEPISSRDQASPRYLSGLSRHAAGNMLIGSAAPEE